MNSCAILVFVRYKATSEGDTRGAGGSSPPTLAPRLSCLSPASKKRRGSDFQPLASSTPTAPAVSRDSAALAQDSTTAVGCVEFYGSPPTNRVHDTESHGGNDAAATATEMAAREISMSVTPTALSWALLSLLADGGTGGEGWGGGHGSGGGGQRGQGHLLPRSRDKYPTPVRGGMCSGLGNGTGGGGEEVGSEICPCNG